jgi:DNA-binding NarL/FixJ family response regulator
MIRILLIDDHAVVRAGYRRFLERSNLVTVVAEGESAEQGYALFRQQAPDVSIVDLSMQGVGGLELIRRIMAHEPQALCWSSACTRKPYLQSAHFRPVPAVMSPSKARRTYWLMPYTRCMRVAAF